MYSKIKLLLSFIRWDHLSEMTNRWFCDLCFKKFYCSFYSTSFHAKRKGFCEI